VAEEAAVRLQIRWNTGRCQLRRVLEKTLEDRQASLVRLLTSLGCAGV
jgi:hypothetical protein